MVESSYTRQDVDTLATLHRSAFPDFFLSRLGHRFLSELYTGYISDPDAVIAVAREETGRLVGVCVGTIRPAGFFSRLLRRQFLGFFTASAIASLRDPRTISRLLAGLSYRGDGPPGLEGALLSSLCVSPEAQGQGIGSTLDREWRRRAAAMGSKTAFLTTDSTNNEAVNSFYKRNGWTLHDHFTTKQGRSMNRYRYDLAGSSGGATE